MRNDTRRTGEATTEMKFPERYRFANAAPGYETKPGDPFGCFIVPATDGMRPLKIIAADGEEAGWEHVSVSIFQKNDRQVCPSWAEMCFVKTLFWDEEECVVEFHPPKSDYVNTHAGVLHLWRCVNQSFPMPPKICV